MKRIFGIQAPPQEPPRNENPPEPEPVPTPAAPQKRTLGALGLVTRSHLERLARIRAAEYNQRHKE